MLRVALDENNDFPPGGPKLVGGVESAGVALQAVFSVQRGEWRYNLLFGMAWRSAVFGKFFNESTTAQMVAATANTIPDITPVTERQVAVDTVTDAAWRQANITINSISLRGTSNAGELFSFATTTSF